MEESHKNNPKTIKESFTMTFKEGMFKPVIVGTGSSEGLVEKYNKSDFSDYNLITYDKLKEALEEVTNAKVEPFQHKEESLTLEYLYKLRDEGATGILFDLGNGLTTGLGGAIAYYEAINKECKDLWYNGKTEEEVKQEQERKYELAESGQKKFRKGGNNRKKTKGRRK